MQTALLVAGIALLTALCLFLCYKWYKTLQFKSMNCRIAEFVFRNVDAYVLLIDKDFNVLKTNYYIVNHKPEEEPRVPPKVGNLFHCTNSIASGNCGCHEMCASCPIRKAVGKAFREQRNFSKLEATLEIYTSDDHATSTKCHVSVTGNCLSTDEGEQMLLTMHDITHLKHIQQELTEARIHAEESDRMKSVFLANTSHELRTPLNAILGFSELLSGDPTTEEKQEYMRIIRANNDLLLQLVNDILDLSKIESGTLEFEFADEDLNAIMEELEGIYCRQQQNTPVHIAFERKYPACRIHADRRRLSQVVSNFLSNAVKFTPKGEILFGYEIREYDYYFYVRDTGAGIPAEKLGQVFDRFVKVRSHKQGVGIGLAICRSIVESIGGEIGVDSQTGKGSTFWFTIPKEQMAV